MDVHEVRLKLIPHGPIEANHGDSVLETTGTSALQKDVLPRLMR